MARVVDSVLRIFLSFVAPPVPVYIIYRVQCIEIEFRAVPAERAVPQFWDLHTNVQVVASGR